MLLWCINKNVWLGEATVSSFGEQRHSAFALNNGGEVVRKDCIVFGDFESVFVLIKAYLGNPLNCCLVQEFGV